MITSLFGTDEDRDRKPTNVRLRHKYNHRDTRSANISHIRPFREFKPISGGLKAGEYEVDKIVDERTDEEGSRWYRVRWRGYTAHADTWHLAKDLQGAPDVLRRWRRGRADTSAKKTRKKIVLVLRRQRD